MNALKNRPPFVRICFAGAVFSLSLIVGFSILPRRDFAASSRAIQKQKAKVDESARSLGATAEDAVEAAEELKLAVEKFTLKIEHLRALEGTGLGISVNFDVDENIEVIHVLSESGHVSIDFVRPGGPAWFAGVEVGDELQAVDGNPVLDMSGQELLAALSGKPGSSVSLTFAANPSEPLVLERKAYQRKPVKVGLGMGIDYADRIDREPRLTSAGKPLPKVDEDGYPLVSRVSDGNPAARSGIRSGDSITHVDGVSTIDMGIDELIEGLRGEEGETRVLGIKDRKTDVLVVLGPLS